MQKLKQITLGIGSTFFSKVLGSICHMATAGIVARSATLEQFGIWAMLLSFVMIAPSFDFGLGGAYLRNEMTKRFDQPNDAASFFFYIFTLLLLIYLGWALLAAILGKGMLIPLALIALRIPFSMNADGFYGFHEGYIRGVLEGVEVVVLSLSAIVGIWMGVSFEQLLILYYTTHLLLAVASFFLFVKRRGWSYHFDRGVQVNFKEGRRFWGIQLLSFAFFTQLPLLIGFFYGAHRAGEFALVYRPISLLVGVQLTLLNPIWSHYTEASVKQDHAWIKQALHWTLLLILGGSLVVLAIYLPFHSQIIALWSGAKLHNPSWALFASLWALLYGVINCYSVVLSAASRVKTQCIALLIAFSLSCLVGYCFSITSFFFFQLGAFVVLSLTFAKEVKKVVEK